MKRMKREKINLLFLINEKFINNFETIYYKAKEDKRFSVFVVTCESKGTDYKSTTPSREIYDYLKAHGIDCFDGYRAKEGKYIDLRVFSPDYIFVSTPYDIYRPCEYHSAKLSKIAKVCDIEYGAVIIQDQNKAILENDYYRNCYKHFICSDKSKELCEDMAEYDFIDKFCTIGCIKLDKFFHRGYRPDKWKQVFPKEDSLLRIVWKPRWTVPDKELFFEILDGLLTMAQKGACQVLLLEHPLLRSSLRQKGFEKEYEALSARVAQSENFSLYSGSDFLDIVIEGDVLIGECTSLMAEYAITERPIIYIETNEALNPLGESLIDKDWHARCAKDVFSLLKLCRHAPARIRKTKKLFFPKKKSITDHLLNLLAEDYAQTQLSYYRKKLFACGELLEKTKETLFNGYVDKTLFKDEGADADEKEIKAGLTIWEDVIVDLKSKE